MARIEAMIDAGVAAKDACALLGMRLATFYKYRVKLKKLMAQARESAAPTAPVDNTRCPDCTCGGGK